MAENKLYIGIDIGGTNTVVGLVDCDGKCVSVSSFKTNAKSFNCFIDDLFKKCDRLFANFPSVLGIGVGVPSANPEKGLVENPINLAWGVIEIVAVINKKYNVPVKIINDANAASLGELKFGVAKDWHSFIHVTLGTGLGASIIVEKKVINGKDGFAGELGHTKIRDRRRKCICGHYGCLETYVSANGICRTVNELFAIEPDESSLKTIKYVDLTPKMIADYAHRGDKIALKAFEITGHVLGEKLADVFSLLNPQGVVLSGGMIAAGEILANPVRNSLLTNLLEIHKRDIEVRISDSNKNVAILGAASLVMDI